MKIREPRLSDVPSIVRIHLRSFPRGFKSYFGSRYLENMYNDLVSCAHVGLVVEDSDSVVRGFVFSDKSPSMRGNVSLSILLSIFTQLLAKSPTFIPILTSRLLLFFKVKVSSEISEATDAIELAYIAVDDELRSQGIGRKLISVFEDNALNAEAYQKCRTRTHNSRLTEYYIKNKNAKIIYEVESGRDYTCLLQWDLKKT